MIWRWEGGGGRRWGIQNVSKSHAKHFRVIWQWVTLSLLFLTCFHNSQKLSWVRKQKKHHSSHVLHQLTTRTTSLKAMSASYVTQRFAGKYIADSFSNFSGLPHQTRASKPSTVPHFCYGILRSYRTAWQHINLVLYVQTTCRQNASEVYFPSEVHHTTNLSLRWRY